MTEADISQKSAATSPRDAIIGALLELAGERHWEDIPLSDIATRANVSLSAFRDAFPSKGAVLAAFMRKIDKAVLDDIPAPEPDQSPKDRLFEVLLRRLEVLKPYRPGLESISEWSVRDPFAAAALNKESMNSMRFMLEAAGIDSEGPVGVVKLQGLALAWRRVLATWFTDDSSDLAPTKAVLERELARGSAVLARVEDMGRLASPLFSIARSFLDRRRGGPQETSKDDTPTTFN
ncbi:MAG TPA: TetR/AcrR family transcriptional regulator [Methylovirgula sp.]